MWFTLLWFFFNSFRLSLCFLCLKETLFLKETKTPKDQNSFLNIQWKVIQFHFESFDFHWQNEIWNFFILFLSFCFRKKSFNLISSFNFISSFIFQRVTPTSTLTTSKVSLTYLLSIENFWYFYWFWMWPSHDSI